MEEFLGQGHDDLDIVGGEHPHPAAQLPLQPVLVQPLLELDHVAELEAELPIRLGLEVVQRLAARHLDKT